MADRMDALSGTALRGPAGSSPEDAPTARGTWQGEAVLVAPPSVESLLDDAKEELTFAIAEQMEIKDIEDRSVEESGSYGERVNEIEGVWKLLDEQLPDLDLDALRALLENFLEQETLSEDDISRMVQERFGDPSHTYAALDTLASELRGHGREEMADRTAAVRDRMLQDNGPAIRAGLNVSATAFEVAAGDRAAAAELRDLYRTTVLAAPGPAGVYRGMIQQFGVDGFSDHLRFLTRAVGDDLAAAGPSVEPARLQELLEDLSALRVLDTAHDRCAQLARRVNQQGPVTLTPTEVLQNLLPLTEEPINGPAKLLALADRLGIPADRYDTRVALLRESRDVLAALPVAVYRDGDARMTLLRAVQEAMDITIEQEEGTA